MKSIRISVNISSRNKALFLSGSVIPCPNCIPDRRSRSSQSLFDSPLITHLYPKKEKEKEKESISLNKENKIVKWILTSRGHRALDQHYNRCSQMLQSLHQWSLKRIHRTRKEREMTWQVEERGNWGREEGFDFWQRNGRWEGEEEREEPERIGDAWESMLPWFFQLSLYVFSFTEIYEKGFCFLRARRVIIGHPQPLLENI